MKLPIDGIQAFVQIAESGSFGKAAEKLHLTQTALSRRIQRLERFVGDRLLDRTTRSTTLAPLGREFLPLAMRLVAELTKGLDALRSSARLAVGDVTVAVLQSVATQQLPAVLRAYARQYPHNRISLLERAGSLVTEAVRLGHADFGVHIQHEPHPELIDEQMLRSPFVLYCRRGHPLAQRDAVTWADLAGVDLVTLGGASGNRRVVERQLVAAGLEARGRFVAESMPTAMALAGAGVGAAVLPAQRNAARGAAGLVQVPLTEPVLHRAIGLVRRRNETLSPAASALYDMLKAQLGGPQVAREKAPETAPRKTRREGKEAGVATPSAATTGRAARAPRR